MTLVMLIKFKNHAQEVEGVYAFLVECDGALQIQSIQTGLDVILWGQMTEVPK